MYPANWLLHLTLQYMLLQYCVVLIDTWVSGVGMNHNLTIQTIDKTIAGIYK